MTGGGASINGGVSVTTAFSLSGISTQPSSTRKANVAASSYSVDTFAEYSSSAISRQSAGGRTLSPQLEEELFRDLFGGELEPESYVINRKSQSRSRPAGGMQWTSGATITAPFPFPHKPQEDRSLSVSTNNLAEMPKLNLSELVIPRPSIEDPSAAVGPNGRRPSLLGQVVEGVCEDEDEERPETDLQSDIFPPFRSGHLRGPYSNNNSNDSGKSALEQETLRFLERLDLKAVLHTPRPEVDSFLPSARSNEPTPRVAQDTIHREVYDAYQTQASQRPAPPGLGPLKEPSHHRPRPKSGRKEPDQAAVSRLAYMESTYGTTKHEPRKARRETIDRLANPIAGYTSTLQALSPEQRRKRELALSNTQEMISADHTDIEKRSPSRVAVPATSLLDELVSASSIYHAAAVSAGKAITASTPDRKTRFRQKYKPTVVISNNQLEDELSSCKKTSSGKRNEKRASSLAERKQVLRAKLRDRESSSNLDEQTVTKAPQPTHDWVTSCSTFLTQREDEEAELSQKMSSSNRMGEVAKSAKQTPRAPLVSGRSAEAYSIPDIPSRKRPNRPARIITRGRGDDISTSYEKKTPHPPPRTLQSKATTVGAPKRQDSRPPQGSKGNVPPTKSLGHQTQVNNGASGRGRIRNNRPAAAAGAGKIVQSQISSSSAGTSSGNSTSRGQKKSGRQGRDAVAPVPANQRIGDVPARGPRVRLVPPRRLSNGSVTSTRGQNGTSNADEVQRGRGTRMKAPAKSDSAFSYNRKVRKTARVSTRDKTASTKTDTK